MDPQFPKLQNGGDTTIYEYWDVRKLDVNKAPDLMSECGKYSIVPFIIIFGIQFPRDSLESTLVAYTH